MITFSKMIKIGCRVFQSVALTYYLTDKECLKHRPKADVMKYIILTDLQVDAEGILIVDTQDCMATTRYDHTHPSQY